MTLAPINNMYCRPDTFYKRLRKSYGYAIIRKPPGQIAHEISTSFPCSTLSLTGSWKKGCSKYHGKDRPCSVVIDTDKQSLFQSLETSNIYQSILHELNIVKQTLKFRLSSHSYRQVRLSLFCAIICYHQFCSCFRFLFLSKAIHFSATFPAIWFRVFLFISIPTHDQNQTQSY